MKAWSVASIKWSYFILQSLIVLLVCFFVATEEGVLTAATLAALGIAINAFLAFRGLDFAVGLGAGMRRRAAREVAPKGLLVDWLMPPDRAEDVLFNILGRYDYWIAKYGCRWARIIFVTQCLGAVVTFWTEWLLSRVKLLRLLRRS